MSVNSDQGYEEAQPLVAPVQDAVPLTQTDEAKKTKFLYLSFMAMVVIGLGNKLFQVLQTYPMKNYPYFLNLLTTFVYIPLSFAYIWPMLYWGTLITPEQRAIPQHKFMVMGALDGIAGLMQTFAVTYLEQGGLITLLMQSAIPLSMVISKIFLKVNYKIYQYLGAAIVAGGIAVVLVPQLVQTDTDNLLKLAIWSACLILSCIPMTLSTVYKEKALGEVDVDVVYLNGYVAIYQLLITLVVAVPSGYASDVKPEDIPKNVWDGMKCYVGQGTADDDHCAMAPIYVNLYLMFNVLYNILIIMILKYGSSNLLWLAMTVMVPLINVAFALPFMPKHKPMTVFDIIGLIVIMGGLIIFRFFTPMKRVGIKIRNAIWKPKVVVH
eukprot:CAMPEP_0168564636 /NCGR_PEP_ID=MMETSP0413-20121227/13360_1 /TAXON_ID=136452 /ORGANISM="Filamoeba nolandi, Strain NC-AS-23-1" /LENGTH=380 /DNA_ID=CAMNT_0008596339 /DNA_START=38 /DNA_END=1177 /DNA_ORIENTATION=-